jgi:Phage integrase, N-terminal SAM-like domain
MDDNGNRGPPQGAVARLRLFESMRAAIGARHYSRRTGQAYLYWIRRFIVFFGKRHPRELGAPEVTAFPGHLAVEERVAAATQNQAQAALLFLHKEVMGEEPSRPCRAAGGEISRCVMRSPLTAYRLPLTAHPPSRDRPRAA